LDPLQFIIKTYNNIITWWNARICLETISIANEPSGWLATHSMIATVRGRAYISRDEELSSPEMEIGRKKIKIEFEPKIIFLFQLKEYGNQ